MTSPNGGMDTYTFSDLTLSVWLKLKSIHNYGMYSIVGSREQYRQMHNACIYIYMPHIHEMPIVLYHTITT